jgi:DNA-binding response OmpR family regulator
VAQKKKAAIFVRCTEGEAKKIRRAAKLERSTVSRFIMNAVMNRREETAPSFRVEADMKRRILVVDDEMAILLTLRAILEMNGFEVETAASGREAISKLQNGSEYHMVITDMKMENEIAGYDVIRAAKQAANNPAVAILTAYPSLGTSWKSEGADSMLVKPMNTEDLLRQIEVLLIQHEDERQRLQRGARPGNARKDVAKRAS